MLFTDTDSLCCHVGTEHLYADMAENIDLVDTSNFETAYPLYSSRITASSESSRVRQGHLFTATLSV